MTQVVQTPRTNRAARWAGVGVLATVLLASLAPLAAAQSDERPRPDRERDGARERPMRPSHAFELSLSGTAVSKDNETYAITIEGGGRARVHTRDGNETDAKGMVRLKVQLLDAEGNVVKEGALKGRFHAHKDAEGEWIWQLVAIGRHARGFPNLVLRGTAVASESALLDLDGAGRAVVKLPEDDRRSVLKLDVSGTLSRA